MMPRDTYTSTSILIVGFIIINYISAEFIFKEKRLNEISKNKFSSKITCYMVHVTSYIQNKVTYNFLKSNMYY